MIFMLRNKNGYTRVIHLELTIVHINRISMCLLSFNFNKAQKQGKTRKGALL